MVPVSHSAPPPNLSTVSTHLSSIWARLVSRSALLLPSSSRVSLLASLTVRIVEGCSDEPRYTAIRALWVEDGPVDQFKKALERAQTKMIGGCKLKRVGGALARNCSKEEIASIFARMERLQILVQIKLQTDHLLVSMMELQDEIAHMSSKLCQAIKECTSETHSNTEVVKDDTRRSSSHGGIEHFDTPIRGKVLRKDGVPLEKGLPEYLVERVRRYCETIELLTEVQLTYELVAGCTPFDTAHNDKNLIPQFQKVIGGVPEKMVQDAFSNGVLKERVDYSSAENFLPLEQLRSEYLHGYKRVTVQLGEGELEPLGRYLRKMLIVDPKQRLLAGTWISEAVGDSCTM
ncbi:hypothetical protein MMC29_002281 [Sticta canariensis]|nr:hypothetical protein [Sticta canariensis]